jgi:ATP/ADP translocase
MSETNVANAMLDRRAYISFAIVLAVAILAAGVAVLWASSGESDVTFEGDVALAIGVFATVILAGGLMTVMFLSDRTGRDR